MDVRHISTAILALALPACFSPNEVIDDDSLATDGPGSSGSAVSETAETDPTGQDETGTTGTSGPSTTGDETTTDESTTGDDTDGTTTGGTLGLVGTKSCPKRWQLGTKETDRRRVRVLTTAEATSPRLSALQWIRPRRPALMIVWTPKQVWRLQGLKEAFVCWTPLLSSPRC